MSKTIILLGDTQKNHALETIQGMALDPENVQCVTIEPYEKVKTRQQEKLYWMRLGFIATRIAFETPVINQETGEVERVVHLHKDKDYWHQYLAFKFLEPDWVLNPITDKETPVPKSTRKLKRKEYSKYMEDICEWARDFGLQLPSPEDLDY